MEASHQTQDNVGLQLEDVEPGPPLEAAKVNRGKPGPMVVSLDSSDDELSEEEKGNGKDGQDDDDAGVPSIKSSIDFAGQEMLSSTPQTTLGHAAYSARLSFSSPSHPNTSTSLLSTGGLSEFAAGPEKAPSFPSFLGAFSSGSGRRRRSILTKEHFRTDEVKELLTFEGHEGLLRGSSLPAILRHGGRIFEDSKGSASTYELSNTVAGIDAFISHNWTVSRKTKFLGLVYHYYFLRAFIAPCIVLLIVGLLHATTELLPTVMDKAEGYEVGIMARVLTIPAFAAMLLSCSEVSACLGGSAGRGPVVFLDKTCIPQGNPALMQQGLSKLGAFICESKHMLAIFSDEYLRKLWTVYEIASFLTMHPTEDLQMLLISVPRLVTIALACMYFTVVVGFLVKMALPSDWGQYIVTSVFAPMVLAAFRGVSKEKAAVADAIANFSVRRCVCSHEDDRPVIYANITILMRKVLELTSDVSEEEVLEQFDILVRNELPQALRAQMGRYIMPMNKVFVVCILSFIPFSIDLIPGYLADDRPLRDLLVRMLGPVIWALSDAPFIIHCAQWLAMQHLKCETLFRERAWCLLVLLLSAAILWSRSLLHLRLLDMALKNNMGLLLYIIYFGLGFLQACWQGYGWTLHRSPKASSDEATPSSDVSIEVLDQPELLQEPVEVTKP